MAKIVAVSDLHGNLPPIPECDILLLGGDICPNSHSLLQSQWLDVAFRHWLEEIPAKHVVGVAGNHDLIFESKNSHLVPSGLRWHYLQHSIIELEGLKIFGSPWTLPICGAFQCDEESMERKNSQIPEGVDIVLLHGPPHGIGDQASRRFITSNAEEFEHTGSPSLRNRLLEIKPKLVVFGHIHEGYGLYDVEGVLFANASLMNISFSPVNYPITFDII